MFVRLNRLWGTAVAICAVSLAGTAAQAEVESVFDASFGAVRATIGDPTGCPVKCQRNQVLRLRFDGRVQQLPLHWYATEVEHGALHFLPRPNMYYPDVFVEQYSGTLRNGGEVDFRPDYFSYDPAVKMYRALGRFQYPQLDAQKFHGALVGHIAQIDVLPFNLYDDATKPRSWARILRIIDEHGTVRLMEYDFGHEEWANTNRIIEFGVGDCLAVGRDLNNVPAIHMLRLGKTDEAFTCK